MTSFTSLTELGPAALSHRSEIEAVKQSLGITHGYFDAWMYGFLENKKFNVEETVSKLQRRFAMEAQELASFVPSEYVQGCLREGIMQEVGFDKMGRVVLYVCTRRDHPKSKNRDDNRRIFDMAATYGTRLRKQNYRSQLVMLIDQKDASFFKNIDLSLQGEIALRISKFYPGGVEKMYICNMSGTLSTFAKPVFKRLSSIVADRIELVEESEVMNGFLLNYIDAESLPVALGGQNTCDGEENWVKYAQSIETYFAGLRRAVLDEGLTVKEWELRQLGIDPHGRSAEPSRGIPSYIESYVAETDPYSVGSSVQELHTCVSDLRSSMVPNHDPYGTSEEECGPSWRWCVADWHPTVAAFFLEELLEWRWSVEEWEAEGRAALYTDYVAEEQRCRELDMDGFNANDGKWYTTIPGPFHALYRQALIGLRLLNLLWMLAAFVLIVALGANLAVTLFFGLLLKPHYVFPLSGVLVMTTMQVVCLSTRAFDYLTAVADNKVIPLWERLGSKWGTVAEVALFAIIAALNFVLFIVYSSTDSVTRALQITFATGMLCWTFVIGITHVFFFTGLFTARHPRRQGHSESALTSLPFFIALNWQSHDSDTSAPTRVRVSSFVICAIPLAVSILLGSGFLLSREVVFCVITIVAAVAGGYAVMYYSDSLSNSLSGGLVRLALWMTTVSWLYAVFTFGFRNYRGEWGVYVISSTLVSGFFLLLSLGCLERLGSSKLLRATFVVMILYFTGCWIASFATVSIGIGLFCLALILHNFITAVFAPKDLTHITATFFVATAVMLLTVSCVLLGWSGVSREYSSPRSLPTASTVSAVKPYQLYHHYPVCLLQSATETMVSVVDMALMTELVSASTGSVFDADFSAWFGDRPYTYNGIAKTFGRDEFTWSLHQFTLSEPGQAPASVYVLQNVEVLNAITSLVLWVDSLALAPLSLFLAYDWMPTFVYVLGFVSPMVDFPWENTYQDLRTFLQGEQKRAANDGSGLFLTARGVAGGLAAVSGVLSETQTVTFSSPGLLHLVKKVDISYAAFHTYVLQIGAYYGILDNVGGRDTTMAQAMHCDGGSSYCTSAGYISSTLLTACGDPRRHT